jgi:adenosylcobinamide kinase/adenosylcobinamide-phosphate guanylyltransferase
VVLDSLAGYTLNRVRILTGGKVDVSDDERHEITKKISGEIQDLYDLLAVNGADGIVLSIETGFSIDPGDPMMKLCKQILGSVNQRVANMSSDVYLSVSGIQFKIK